MLTSKRWITSKEIRDSLDITSLELLDWIKDGLQVYDKHGRPTDYDKLSWSHPGGQTVNLSRTGTPARNIPRIVNTQGNRLENLDKSIFKTKEVESYCLENGLLPGQVKQTPSDHNSDPDPDNITLAEVTKYPRSRIEELYKGKHKERSQIRCANRAVKALKLSLEGVAQENIYHKLSRGSSRGKDAARQARDWISTGRELILSERRRNTPE